MVANDYGPAFERSRAVVFLILNSHKIFKMREMLARKSDQVDAGPLGSSAIAREIKTDRPKQALLLGDRQGLFGSDPEARISFSDFDENERVVLTGDDVDLAAAIDNISSQDFVAIFD